MPGHQIIKKDIGILMLGIGFKKKSPATNAGLLRYCESLI